VACHVGDWVEVQCDYSPGTCSEGGTGVVVATVGGIPTPISLTVSSHLTIIFALELDELVKEGGPCDGAIVVHQEDNAGPHIDKTYKDWLQAEFDRRGWKLEHQAPQVIPLP
jgi:hypothetical protein